LTRNGEILLPPLEEGMLGCLAAAVASLIDTLRAGRGGVVVVGGPAGIGKSRLLAEAAKHSSSRPTCRRPSAPVQDPPAEVRSKARVYRLT
jgi:hypothetical protein